MRVMLMAHPGTNSRDILLDVEAGFRQAGHEVIRWEFEPMQRLQSRVSQAQGRAVLSADLGEMVRSLVKTNRVDFTLAMWGNGLLAFGVGPSPSGTTAMSFFERARVRHVLFWLDAPHWAHQGSMSQLFRTPVVAESRLFHVINNEGLAEEMRRALGFGRVLGRRYGVNPEVFKPWPGVTVRHELMFNAGPGDPPPTALMLRELESGDPDVGAIRREAAGEARRRMGAAAAEAGDLGGGVEGLLDAWIRTQLEDPGTPVLTRLDAAAAGDGAIRGSLESLLNRPRAFVQIAEHARGVERFRRAFTLSYLSRHFDCGVFGPEALAGWPHKAKSYGGVPYREMAKMYGTGRLSVNAMRWQDDEGLNIKPFEITASGSACLCDARGGLGAMFEVGREIAAYSSPGEARRIAAELLASPDRLAAMAEAGRARTLRDHSWASWADDICRFVAGAEGA
jgi:hypothetical protein